MTSNTILLVDNDSDLLQVVGQRCRNSGLNVQHARNLLTAAAMVDKFVPDIVCVDVEMPTGNDLRFCEALAADPRTARVPIIVLTGRKDAETLRKCERIGAHYAFKSAETWTTLEPIIRRLLSGKPPERPRTTTGIRPRNLPTHMIPPWPAEADAGYGNRADAGYSDRADAGYGNRADAGNGNKTNAGNRNWTDAGCTDNSANRQVVVADDDHELVHLLSARLSLLGCSVIGVNTSLDAINAIHRVQPKLVVLDVNMPTGSGLSIGEMMATDERLRLVPVITLTGCSDERTIRRCHDMLVFYVQKGADIWSRIDPLVRKLLHLGDAPLPKEPMADEWATGVDRQPTPIAAAGGGETDSLMDAVFAMLGADDGANAGGGEIQVAGPRGEVEAPWVLCIDDDFDFSDVLKIRFDNYGVAVARAANGMAGLRMAFSTPARAILLDYQMPNGQGDYILGRLKDNPVTCDIPVIMITGIKDKMLERRVMAMGAAGYFLKPVDFESLRERLAEYIDALAQPVAQLALAER